MELRAARWLLVLPPLLMLPPQPHQLPRQTLRLSQLLVSFDSC